MSFPDAEKMYGVSKSTLNRKLNNMNMWKAARLNTLTEEDEKNLVKGIRLDSKWGFPFTSINIRLLMHNFLSKKGVKKNRFKNNIHGYDSFKHFCLKTNLY